MVGHEFYPLNGKTIVKAKYHRRGIEVTMAAAANGELANHDFVDATQARVKVEVAGGMKQQECNHNLGVSTIEFTLDGCDSAHYKRESTQSQVQNEYSVPAHRVTARVTALQRAVNGDREFIMKVCFELAPKSKK